MQSFMLPANGKATPESIARKRKMAELMMSQGMQTGPVGHWTQGAARMAQALAGGFASRRADEQDFALQAETKKEAMARQLLEDNWRKEGRAHDWDQDALNNARMVGQDAMARTTFQNQLEDRQTQQDQLAAQQGVYEDQIQPTNTHNGPQQLPYSPEQLNQAQMYAAGGDYSGASGFLNPVQKPQDPYTLGQGDIRLDANNQPVAENPKTANLPSGVQEYEYAKGQGFPGTFQEWEAAKRMGMTIQSDGQGGFTLQQGVGVKPLTEGQSKDVGFATRAEGANPLLEQYEDALTGYGDTALGAVPYGLGQGLKSTDYQLAEQAGNEFLTAFLRKDSGATITDSEESLYGRIYLPRPGDSKELVLQKRQSRQRAIEGINAGLPPSAIVAKEIALQKSQTSGSQGVEEEYDADGNRIK